METTGEDASVSGEKATPASLSGLPPSIVCFGVSEFLPVKDILSMSQTCRVLHRSIIPDPKTNKKKVERNTGTDATTTTVAASSSSNNSQRDDNILLWEKILERDFGLTFGSFGVSDKNSVYVIPTQQDRSGVSNIAPQGMVLPVTSSFEAYRQWKKTSLKFYKGSNGRENDNVNAGYFTRAALMWQKIAMWCNRNGEFGAQLLNTFLPGISYADVLQIEEHARTQKTTLKEEAVAAIRAIFSFCRGQDGEQGRVGEHFLSLLGVYNAYDFFTNNYYTGNLYWYIAFSPIAPRRLSVDIETGKLSWWVSPRERVQATSHTGGDCVLNWFEEYARRLTNNIYRVGAIQGSYDSDPDSLKGINLYPWPCLGENGEEDSITGPLVSRRVTKGIEVIASGVWVPQMSHIGFIYSIRMRLLEEGQDGYLSPQERGFTSAQLVSRHWKIYHKANDRTDLVNGDGVIGMVPILEDGGYREPGLGTGEFTSGWFTYQSCTGFMEEGGNFCGHITFRTINASSQHFFDVEVGKFKLDTKPDFLY